MYIKSLLTLVSKMNRKQNMSNEKVHPAHYNDSKITPFDIWDDWKLDPYTATAIKYIKRAGKKDGESEKDDLEKAIDYLKERIKRIDSK